MKDNAMQIAFILDRSGSMGKIAAGTVEGVNAFLAEQKNATTETSIRFVQFDNEYEDVYNGKIDQAPLLTLSEKPGEGEVRFQPRGSTALLYAIGHTMDELGKSLEAMPEADRPAKVVVVIMTDGYENASEFMKPVYDMAKIAEMIRVQRSVYNWQFQFLGANQDAIATAAKMNISGTNAISYFASNTGTSNVMRAAATNVHNYGVTGQCVCMDFSDEERGAAMEKDEPAPAKP